jgi:hypothetical protein
MADILSPDNESASERAADHRFAPLANLADVSQRYGMDLPVETWHPPFCGTIDMRIAKDGTWFYQGTMIERPALVRLFSRLLRKDEERYVLVTPVECVGITVEDVPFIAAQMEVNESAAGPIFKFRTNAGDTVCADRDHALRFETGEADGLMPYILVRGGLWARLTRALTVELMAYGCKQEIDGREMFGIASAGVFFSIAAAKDFE